LRVISLFRGFSKKTAMGFGISMPLFGFGSVEVIINAIKKPKVIIITGKNLDLKITLNKFFIILYLLK